MDSSRQAPGAIPQAELRTPARLVLRDLTWRLNALTALKQDTATAAYSAALAFAAHGLLYVAYQNYPKEKPSAALFRGILCSSPIRSGCDNLDRPLIEQVASAAWEEWTRQKATADAFADASKATSSAPKSSQPKPDGSKLKSNIPESHEFSQFMVEREGHAAYQHDPAELSRWCVRVEEALQADEQRQAQPRYSQSIPVILDLARFLHFWATKPASERQPVPSCALYSYMIDNAVKSLTHLKVLKSPKIEGDILQEAHHQLLWKQVGGEAYWQTYLASADPGGRRRQQFESIFQPIQVEKVKPDLLILTGGLTHGQVSVDVLTYDNTEDPSLREVTDLQDELQQAACCTNQICQRILGASALQKLTRAHVRDLLRMVDRTAQYYLEMMGFNEPLVLNEVEKRAWQLLKKLKEQAQKSAQAQPPSSASSSQGDASKAAQPDEKTKASQLLKHVTFLLLAMSKDESDNKPYPHSSTSPAIHFAGAVYALLDLIRNYNYPEFIIPTDGADLQPLRRKYPLNRKMIESFDLVKLCESILKGRLGGLVPNVTAPITPQRAAELRRQALQWHAWETAGMPVLYQKEFCPLSLMRNDPNYSGPTPDQLARYQAIFEPSTGAATPTIFDLIKGIDQVSAAAAYVEDSTASPDQQAQYQLVLQLANKRASRILMQLGRTVLWGSPNAPHKLTDYQILAFFALAGRTQRMHMGVPPLPHQLQKGILHLARDSQQQPTAPGAQQQQQKPPSPDPTGGPSTSGGGGGGGGPGSAQGPP